MLMGALVTFLVVILILYLINLLPLDGRAKQIARRRDHPRRNIAAEVHRSLLRFLNDLSTKSPGECRGVSWPIKKTYLSVLNQSSTSL